MELCNFRLLSYLQALRVEKAVKQLTMRWVCRRVQCKAQMQRAVSRISNTVNEHYSMQRSNVRAYRPTY